MKNNIEKFPTTPKKLVDLLDDGLGEHGLNKWIIIGDSEDNEFMGMYFSEKMTNMEALWILEKAKHYVAFYE